MPVTEATLRRIAAMPHEAAIEALLFLADQLGAEEARKSKDRERKRRGKSTEFHGNDLENPRNSTEASDAVIIVNNTTTLQDTDKPTSSSTPLTRHQRRIARGTRWPDDFTPKPATLEYAKRFGMTEARYWDEFERTKHFWQQRPGSKGLSLDWNLVWLNRIKELCDRIGASNGRTSTYSKPLSISERLAGFAAKLDQADGEGGDCGGGEDAAGLPRLRQSA